MTGDDAGRGLSAAVGHQASMEVRLISLPMHESLAAAHDDGPPPNRELVTVRVTMQGGGLGWGEGSALNRPSYTDEFARQSFATLTAQPGALELHPHRTPMAWAALANAVDDLLFLTEPDFAALRGEVGSTKRVAAGAALGFAPLEELEARAGALGDSGFQRIKVKIGPDHHRDAVRVVRSAAPKAAIHVDANASLAADHLSLLEDLVAAGVTAIEQPFAPADIAAAQALIGRVDVPVVADEAVHNLQDVMRLAGLNALTGVSIKGPRVGGLRSALAIADWCVENGVAATAGGMLESGLGRAALARLATHQAFTLAGDVSPAGRWLVADPFPDLVQDGADVVVAMDRRLSPLPDPALLDEFTIEQARIPGPRFLIRPGDPQI